MTARKGQLDTLALVSLLLCCGLWGVYQVATKLTLPEIPPLQQAALRSIGAGLLVAAWVRAPGPARSSGWAMRWAWPARCCGAAPRW